MRRFDNFVVAKGITNDTRIKAMHIDAEYLLLEHFEKPETSMIIRSWPTNPEIDLLSPNIFVQGPLINCVQSALKVNILHQYA